MGSTASKPPADTITAEVDPPTAKRKIAVVDLNYSRSDVEQELEKKRKLEDDEPYNDVEVRQKATKIGLEKAMSSSVGEASKVSQNVAPRDLSSEGDESSEFVSADEAGGVTVQEGVTRAVVTEDDFEETRMLSSLGVREETPETRFLATAGANADAYIAELMRGYHSQPAQYRPYESESEIADPEEEEQEEEEEEEEDEDSRDESGSDSGEEETQVVQESMQVDPNDAGLTTPPLDRDSGHGSMDSNAEVESAEQSSETSSDPAVEQMQIDGSQDRMSAVEETVRQIKAERNGDVVVEGHSQEESSDSEDASHEDVNVDSGTDADEARKQYVADRKARKKERHALLALQRRQLAAQQLIAQPVDTTEDSPTPAPLPALAPEPLVDRISMTQQPFDSTHLTATESKRLTRGSKQRAKKLARRAALGTTQTLKSRKRTSGETRRMKRERRAVARERLARKIPEAYVSMLEAKIVDMPALARDADEETQREHRRALKRVKRARTQLALFHETTLNMTSGEETEGEGGMEVVVGL